MSLIEPQNYFSLIEKSLADRKFPSVLYFFGEESYLIDQAVNYIRSCVVDPSTRDFNEKIFVAKSVSGAEIREELETLPMMASHRFVLVREIADLKDSDWQELAPIFLSENSSAVLVMVSAKADRRKKAILNLIEKSVCVEFRKPYDNQIPGWIRHIVKGHGLEISDEAVGQLHRKVGSSLVEIEAEVQKLKNYLGERSAIKPEDVNFCVSQRREESIFDFTERLARGELGPSLLQAVQLLDQGESEIGIVSLCARHFRILLALRRGEAQGLMGPKLAVAAQIPPYFLADYLRQSKSWSSAKLESGLTVLADTEKALKSSPLSGGIWIESMIQKITQLKNSSQERGLTYR